MPVWSILVRLLLTSGMLIRVQAQQGIVLTLSSGELCFGQTVTLTCTHPDPFQESDKYQPASIRFIENINNEVLDLSASDTAQKFTLAKLNSTASTLSFTVTEEDYANVTVICSCYLSLKGDGGRDKSDPITINIEETIQPPTLVSTPNSTSGLLQWNSPSSNCSNYQYSFTLTWVRTGDNSTGTNATAENWYDFTGMPGGNYTVNITAAIAGVNLNESEPLIVNFTAPSMTETSTEDQAPATKPPDDLTDTYAGVGAGCLILILIAIAGVIIAAICYKNCRNRKKRVSQSSPKLKGGSFELKELHPSSSLKNLKKPEAENIGVDPLELTDDPPPADDLPARETPSPVLRRGPLERHSIQTPQASGPTSPLHVAPGQNIVKEISISEQEDPRAAQASRVGEDPNQKDTTARV